MRVWTRSKLSWVTLVVILLFGPVGAGEKIVELRDNFYRLKIVGDQAWVVGYYGTALSSANRGRDWTILRTGVDRALFGLDFVDGESGWAVGAYGTIIKTSNGGKAWKPIKSGLDEHLMDVDFVDGMNGWIVGSRGTILHSSDGGETWTNQSLGEDKILNCVVFADTKKGWLVGEFGVIYQTKDGGDNWVKQKSPVEVAFASGESRNLFRVILTPTGLWAVGLDGVMIRSRDGEKWEVVPVPPLINKNKNHLFDAFQIGDQLWITGQRGTMIVGHESSENWTAPSVRTVKTLNGIAFGQDGWGLAIGNRGTIFRTDNSGEKWSEVQLQKE